MKGTDEGYAAKGAHEGWACHHLAERLTSVLRDHACLELIGAPLRDDGVDTPAQQQRKECAGLI